MAEVCNTCGLPEELCVCEDVSKTEKDVEVTTEERSYDKVVTIVSGLKDDNINISDLASELKSTFACGGTVDDGTIELQGNHKDGVRDELEDRGFNVV